MSRRTLYRIATTFILCLGILAILLPLYMTVITAFKSPGENAASFFAFPRSFYTKNFEGILGRRYYRALVNSFYVTGATLLAGVFVMPMMSYAIARSMPRSRVYRYLYYFILLGLFIPFQVRMMPIVKLMSTLGMLNQTGLVILASSGAICVGTFLYVGFLDSIPQAMEEAARIDGASTWQTFRLIVFPLMTPMIATVLINDGLWMWNDFLMPLIVLNRSWENWTVPLFLYNFKTEYTVDYGLSFATFTISMLPIMVFYSLMQKRILAGLTAGAVKS